MTADEDLVGRVACLIDLADSMATCGAEVKGSVAAMALVWRAFLEQAL